MFEQEYVPAKIEYNNVTYKIKLRLKGDLINEHLGGNKWSFRVKLKGDNTILGMKRFSIHHPQTRNYLYEWVFHKILDREDVVSMRYDFIDVVLNGKDLGVYALEEHFEKRLLENNQRKEGPILKFNENLRWRQVLKFWYDYKYAIPSGFGEYESSYVDAFNTDKDIESLSEPNDFTKSIALMESFRKGDLSTSEVFDIDKMSTCYAIMDVAGSLHAAYWFNMRFYL